MTIESLKREPQTSTQAEIITIGLSGGHSLSFSSAYLEGEGESGCWQPGRELSPEEAEEIEFAASCFRVEKKALALIARAEQTVRGLTHKLEARGFAKDCAGAVTARFVELGLIDDRRFGELWLRARLSRNGGKAETPRSLLFSLQNRGLDKDTAAQALSRILDSETENVILSRYVEKKGFSEEEKADSFLRNHLKSEGFSSSLINNCFL